MPVVTIEDAFNLALEHHRAGRLDEAESIYRQIIVARPDHADSIHLLGVVALQKHQTPLAIQLITKAIGLQPSIAIYYNNLGQAYERLGRRPDATVAYRKALERNPDYPEARNNLANMLERDDWLAEAIVEYKTAIRLLPSYAEPYTNLGNIYKDQGDLDDALACYREAIKLKPGMSVMHSNLLLTLHYHIGYSTARIAAEHRAWARRHADPLKAAIRPHANSRAPGRRIRIGYVSPDYRDHPVARFLSPLLINHDREAFEVFAYADVPLPDAATDRLREAVDTWRDIHTLDDHGLAELVRADQIDILVDLVAHTARSRLLAFAEKPAPVQVTYLAYCSTTGLDTIDYRLSDPYLDPTWGEVDYTEATVRLPETYWCYTAPETSPDVAELPARRTQQITFGCLNNFCKVTPPTISLWSRLLAQVPDASLLLFVRSGSHRQRIAEAFSSQGVDPARVRFVGTQSFEAYLATYNQIDLGLDPMPFTGGTTTCDALWMGVPVVTLAGNTAVARGGYSLLSNLGLPELVARDEATYLQIATDLAADRTRLSQLRATLRARLKASPIMDAPKFTRQIEHEFRAMWQRWCESR